MKRTEENEITVSVIIPTHNRSGSLQLAIRSVWDQICRDEKIEIIVVDNCSTDDTPEVIKALHAQSACPLLYYKTPSNLGPSFSRNMGLKYASGEFVLFLDSDVRLGQDWIRRSVGAMRKDSSIGILAGKLVYAWNPDIINSYGGELSIIGLGWDADDGRASSTIQNQVERLWVSTASMMTRRSIIDIIGDFDDKFFISYEDLDFGWRANIAGYRVLCFPDVIAYHNPGEIGADYDLKIMYHCCKNRLRTMVKNYSLAYLLRSLPLYLVYTLLDVVLFGLRGPKIKALFWNLRELGDTLQKRSEVQKNRKREDSRLSRLFSAGLFPPVPRRRRGRFLGIISEKGR